MSAPGFWGAWVGERGRFWGKQGDAGGKEGRGGEGAQILYPSGTVAGGMGQFVGPPAPSGKREVTTAPVVGGTKRLGEVMQVAAAPPLQPNVRPVKL